MMPPISQDRIDAVESLKTELDWSWDTIAKRFGWTPHYLRQFRTSRAPVGDGQLAWLTAVRDAIAALPPPPTEVWSPPEAPAQPEEVRVMLLDDIATRLIEEYFGLDALEASAEEIAGARYMIGRLADRLGVASEVRDRIRAQRPPVPAPAAIQTGRATADPTMDPTLEPAATANFARHSSLTGIGAFAPARTVGNPFDRANRVPMNPDEF